MAGARFVLALALAPVCAPSVAAPAQEPAREPAAGWRVVQTLTPELAVAATRLVELDARPGQELVVVGEEGEVQVWSWGKAFTPIEGAPLRLANPSHALVALVDVLGAGRPQLVVVSPDGARAHAVLADGRFDPEGVVLSRRARFTLRTDVPVFADFVSDVNGDGRPDLVVPTRTEFELWLNEGREDGQPDAAPHLRKAATVDLTIVRSARYEAQDLSDELVSSVSVPRLRTSDVNGDGRPDLLVARGDVRSFHLQRDDGSYPAQPDISVDLSIFEDTSPQAKVRPGEIVGSGDEREYHSLDLDGDGIPDYVIAHRRKVWVFHGDENGPQFTRPTAVLKVADDVTALTVLPIDDDPYPDLLLFKLELPGVAGLVMGLLRDWDVSVRVVGYANQGGRRFQLEPKWRRDLTMRLPPILQVVRHPEQFLERFAEIGRRIRVPTEGDFDGDGRTDLVMLDPEGKAVRYWHTPAGEAPPEPEKAGAARLGEEMLRRVLFEDQDGVWTIDRALELFSNFTASRLEALAADREPDSVTPLRDAKTYALAGMDAADVDGDGREELLIYYDVVGARRRLTLDVTRLP